MSQTHYSLQAFMCFVSWFNDVFSVFNLFFFPPHGSSGLESAKSEKHEEAFSCFLAAAQHGYSKAQFNTAVCYEKGRGVRKNKTKVTFL